MNNNDKITSILGTSPEVLLALDQALATLTGKQGILEEISLDGPSFVPEELVAMDAKLMKEHGNALGEVALKVFTPPKGFFIKKEKAIELLRKNPPQSLIDHFDYDSLDELIEKEGFESVMSALRFTQSTEWMHNFFEVVYSELTAEDFEERDVQVKILDTKWLGIADKFIGKKLHNVSHLKEHGIIFVIPVPAPTPEEGQGPDQSVGVDTAGETLRTFMLLLHYLHEVPFYSNLFRKYVTDSDFSTKLKSLLRGDVLNELRITNYELRIKKGEIWLIIQRYLAKDNPQDSRLFIPHVNPEAEHWYLVGQDLSKVESELGLVGISKWAGSDWSDSNLIDLVMSMVTKGENKYVYHQREALWNRIFAGYFGRDKMNAMIEENLIRGFIEL